MVKFSKYIIFNIGLTLFFGADLSAQSNNYNDQVRKYFKCFQQFTNLPAFLVVQNNVPDYLRIKNGEISASEGCVNLLNLANFTQNDQIDQNLDADTKGLAMSILRSIHSFHLTWFENKYPGQSGNEGLIRTSQIADYSMPAYYLTRSFFNADIDFSTIVTSNKGLKAIRQSDYPRTNRMIYGGEDDLVEFARGEQVFAPDSEFLAPLGQLIGITEEDRNLIYPFYEGGSVFEHIGAGLIGTVPYLSLNSSFRALKSNGGLNVARTLSKQILKDLLCRDIPVLRSSDVLGGVQLGSELPFRTSTACQQCHYTIDPLAYGFRNKWFRHTNSAHMGTIHSETPSLPDMSESPDNDKNFYKRDPAGIFRIRGPVDDYASVQELNFQDYSGLGQTLAGHFGLYMCSAKRYLNFLTGIDLPLYDFKDPDAIGYNPKEFEVYQELKTWAEWLKVNQDAKGLIKQIIDSRFY
jgi:hypothetical protein